MDTRQAQAVIAQELKKKLSRVVAELESIDALLSKADLKGSKMDINTRSAAIALMVAVA